MKGTWWPQKKRSKGKEELLTVGCVRYLPEVHWGMHWAGYLAAARGCDWLIFQAKPTSLSKKAAQRRLRSDEHRIGSNGQWGVGLLFPRGI